MTRRGHRQRKDRPRHRSRRMPAAGDHVRRPGGEVCVVAENDGTPRAWRCRTVCGQFSSTDEPHAERHRRTGDPATCAGCLGG